MTKQTRTPRDPAGAADPPRARAVAAGPCEGRHGRPDRRTRPRGRRPTRCRGWCPAAVGRRRPPHPRGTDHRDRCHDVYPDPRPHVRCAAPGAVLCGSPKVATSTTPCRLPPDAPDGGATRLLILPVRIGAGSCPAGRVLEPTPDPNRARATGQCCLAAVSSTHSSLVRSSTSLPSSKEVTAARTAGHPVPGRGARPTSCTPASEPGACPSLQRVGGSGRRRHRQRGASGAATGAAGLRSSSVWTSWWRTTASGQVAERSRLLLTEPRAVRSSAPRP